MSMPGPEDVAGAEPPELFSREDAIGGLAERGVFLEENIDQKTLDKAADYYDHDIARDIAKIARNKARFGELIEFDATDPQYQVGSILAADIADDTYLVDELIIHGGRIFLAADAKFGKTTLVMNLVRSLLDGNEFLGTFKARPYPDAEMIREFDLEGDPGRIAILDGEMNKRMIKRWYSRLGLSDDAKSRVLIYPLGDAPELMGRMNLLDDEVVKQWVTWFKEMNVKMVIVDPVVTFLAAAGLSENDNADVSTWLLAFEEMCTRAGIETRMVVHHSGHGASRARGASRWDGWPDVYLTGIYRHGDDDDDTRFLKCHGRDVGFRKTPLVMLEDEITLELLTDLELAPSIIAPPTRLTDAVRRTSLLVSVLSSIHSLETDGVAVRTKAAIIGKSGKNKSDVSKLLDEISAPVGTTGYPDAEVPDTVVPSSSTSGEVDPRTTGDVTTPGAMAEPGDYESLGAESTAPTPLDTYSGTEGQTAEKTVAVEADRDSLVCESSGDSAPGVENASTAPVIPLVETEVVVTSMKGNREYTSPVYTLNQAGRDKLKELTGSGGEARSSVMSSLADAASKGTKKTRPKIDKETGEIHE